MFSLFVVHSLSTHILASLLVLGMAATGAMQPGTVTRTGGPVSRRTAAGLFGRLQAPELITTLPFAVLTQPILNRNVNLTRPLESLKIVWRGRVVIATANFTAVAAEAPQTIIQRIRLTGTHVKYNQLVPIDMTGASAWAWTRCFQVRGSSSIINNTRQADPSVPFAQVGATFGNTGTYDLEVHYHVPLGPMLGPHSRVAVIPYWYSPTDWADSLQLQLFFGDNTSFGTPGTAVTTFTAFGSGTGSPTVYVYGVYGILGPLAQDIQFAVTIRNEQIIVGGVVGAVANTQQLIGLAKQKTTNILVKTGTVLTGSSAGVQVYGTLVDNSFDRTQVLLDNKPIRNNQANFAMKEYSGHMFNTVEPGGYLPISFIESQQTLTFFRGDQLPGGSAWALVTDVIAAPANSACSIVQEMIFGDPKGLSR